MNVDERCENKVLDEIVKDVVDGFRNSSEVERLRVILIYGGDEKSRNYVCDGVYKNLPEIDVISKDFFEKIPDSYSCDLGYFLKIVTPRAIA